MKKCVKICVMYVLITSYCCYLTDELVLMNNSKNGNKSGEVHFEFAWKHIFENIKLLFNR